MEITLVGKTIKIVDTKTYILREDNLVDLKNRNDYLLLETNQVNTPIHLRIYRQDVTVPTSTSLADLYTKVRGYFDAIKNEPLAT